jgi:hypothetical protein
VATNTFDIAPVSIAAVPDPCEDAGTLVSKAERCRRLAAGITDKQTTDVLMQMAQSYEQAAERLQPQARD